MSADYDQINNLIKWSVLINYDSSEKWMYKNQLITYKSGRYFGGE